jgi:prolyl 4-hydroxylase
MDTVCAKSCGTCEKLLQSKATEADTGLEALIAKTATFGEKQSIEGKDQPLTLERVRRSVEYMQSHEAKQLPKDLYDNCRNLHTLCSFWAALGECEKNQAYMVTNCAPACNSCIMLNMEARCPPLVNPKAALVPGGLNKMFERIVSTAPGNRTTLSDSEKRELVANNMTLYSVTVPSRPSTSPAIEISLVLDQSLPPWVVVFDNFLTDEECDALVQLGYKAGYERSQDVGEKRFDGTYDGMKSEGRTSENAWCSSRSGCRDEDVPQRIHDRMAKVMEIPPENSEDFQILKVKTWSFCRFCLLTI